MVNEKQPFELRCAILYCLQSYLHKNPTRQKEVMRTLLPQQESTVTEAGKIIKIFDREQTLKLCNKLLTSQIMLRIFLLRYMFVTCNRPGGMGGTTGTSPGDF